MKKAIKIILVVILIFVLMFSCVQILNKLIPWWYVPRFSMAEYNLVELPVYASGIDIGEITDIDTLLTKTLQVWTDTFLPIVGEGNIGKCIPDKEDLVVYYDPDTDCWLVTEIRRIVPELAAQYPHLIVRTDGEVLAVILW